MKLLAHHDTAGTRWRLFQGDDGLYYRIAWMNHAQDANLNTTTQMIIFTIGHRWGLQSTGTEAAWLFIPHESRIFHHRDMDLTQEDFMRLVADPERAFVMAALA